MHQGRDSHLPVARCWLAGACEDMAAAIRRVAAWLYYARVGETPVVFPPKEMSPLVAVSRDVFVGGIRPTHLL